MSKFSLRERFIYNFETALERAGLLDGSVEQEENLPKYYRGEVVTTNADLFLMYQPTEPNNLESADNQLYRQQMYIDGQLFTRSGYGDSNFQELAEAIERECKNAKIFIKWGSENRDEALDTESPIYFINFEAEQRLLNKEN